MTELPVAAVICVAAANLLMAGVFAILRARDARPGLGWFAAAWMLEAARHLISITPDNVVTFFAGGVTFALAVLALLEGSFRFAGRPPSRILRVAVAALVGWQVVVYFWGPSFVVWHLPVSAFVAITRLIVAAMLFRSGGPWLGRGVATAAMTLWGVHALSYPFLANVPSAAPWGFALSAFLGLATALGVVMAYFERAREEIDASETRMRSVFDGASDGIATLDRDGRVVTANPALARLLGLEGPEALEGERLGELVHRDRAFTDRTVSGVETWRRSDGETRLVSVSISKARTGDRLERIDVFVRDVTRETRLKHELEETRRLEALGRLAGGVAHDFNNLLQVISGAAEIAARSDDPARRAKNLGFVTDAATRAAELTRQLLTVGRRQAVEARDVDLGAVVRELGPWVGRLLGDEVILGLEVEGERLVVSADRGQLEQVLVNLVTNARDAMPDGGRVTIAVRADGDDVRLSVQDEGTGMDEATRSRIFEPFFSTKERSRGTGLGLATVHGIAAQHGWTLDVESALGEGTTFTLRLPRAAPSSARAPAPAAPAARATSGQVLLVDDDPMVLDVSARTLDAAGYSVCAVGPGGVSETALADGCDVLVTDVSMPGESGPDLARRARRLRPGLPVVFVSGYAAVDRLSLDEHTAFVAKPFRADELVAAIEHVRAASAMEA